jgi:hypothetical protein
MNVQWSAFGKEVNCLGIQVRISFPANIRPLTCLNLFLYFWNFRETFWLRRCSNGTGFTLSRTWIEKGQRKMFDIATVLPSSWIRECMTIQLTNVPKICQSWRFNSTEPHYHLPEFENVWRFVDELECTLRSVHLRDSTALSSSTSSMDCSIPDEYINGSRRLAPTVRYCLPYLAEPMTTYFSSVSEKEPCRMFLFHSCLGITHWRVFVTSLVQTTTCEVRGLYCCSVCL